MARKAIKLVKKPRKLSSEPSQASRRRQQEKEFVALQRYGSNKARKRGVLTEKDIEAIVFRNR